MTLNKVKWAIHSFASYKSFSGDVSTKGISHKRHLVQNYKVSQGKFQAEAYRRTSITASRQGSEGRLKSK